MHRDYSTDFRQSMRESGIHYDGEILNNEKCNRFPGIGKPKSNTDGWYIFKGDHGAFGDWSSDISRRWVADDSTFSSKEKSQLQAKTLTLREEVYTQSAKMAQEAWSQLELKGISEYLEKKCLNSTSSLDIRFYRDHEEAYIAVPIRDTKGALCSFEKIYDHGLWHSQGGKRGFKGGKRKGNFHVFGKLTPHASVYITEGFATGASVHLATNLPTIVCFGINNIELVVQNLRQAHPTISLRIAGDVNDKDRTNVIAQGLGISTFFPTFSNPEGNLKDWNDLHVHEGLEAVVKQLIDDVEQADILIDAQQWLTLELPPQRYLVSPIIAEKSLTMLYAERGIGKTFVALNMAMALANGCSVFGSKWKVNAPTKVLYIDGEMPAQAFQQRIRGLALNHQKTHENSYFSNLVTYSADVQNSPLANIATPEGQAKVDTLLKRAGNVQVLILDNLSCLARGGDDNEGESWLPIQEWLIRLRSSGLAVLILHHSNKSGGQRGTSRREDVLDTVITLKRPADYMTDQGARFQIHFEKTRGFHGEDALGFEVWLKNSEKRYHWAVTNYQDMVANQIVAAFEAGLKARDIEGELNLKKIQFARLIQDLRRSGRIE